MGAGDTAVWAGHCVAAAGFGSGLAWGETEKSGAFFGRSNAGLAELDLPVAGELAAVPRAEKLQVLDDVAGGFLADRVFDVVDPGCMAGDLKWFVLLPLLRPRDDDVGIGLSVGTGRMISYSSLVPSRTRK